MKYLSVPILLLTVSLMLFVVFACSDEGGNDSSMAVALPTYTPLAPLPTYTPLAPLPTYTPLAPLPTYTPLPWRLDEDAEYYYRTANSFYQIENYEKALNNISNAILLNPNDILGYELRGRIHVELDNHHLAISDFTNALFLMPEYSYALEHMNLSKKRRDSFTDKAYFDNYKAVLFSLRATEYESLGSSNGAITDYETAITLFNQDNPAFYELIFWAYKSLISFYLPDNDTEFTDTDKVIYLIKEIDEKHSELVKKGQTIHLSESTIDKIIRTVSVGGDIFTQNNQSTEAIRILSNLISEYDHPQLHATRAAVYLRQFTADEINDIKPAFDDAETCIQLGGFIAQDGEDLCVELAILLKTFY